MSVRYTGFLTEPTGYGAAARGHLKALRSTGQQVHARAVRITREGYVDDSAALHPDLRQRASSEPAHTGPTLVHTPPLHFPHLRDPVVRNVGVTVWETDVLPAGWGDALRTVDEVWVPSHFCRDVFERYTTKRIRVVPHPIAVPPDEPVRTFPGIPDDLLLFCSVLQWSDRKNPDGLVRAFRRAFAGRSDVGLALKLGWRVGRVQRRDVLTALSRMTMGIGKWACPPLFVIGDEVDDNTMKRLFSRTDAYVSLHRAEGFGITIAEAMAAGKPCIATRYSGNLEFMDDDCALLIPYRLVSAKQRLARTWFDESMQWAEPDHDSAVDAMRALAVSETQRHRLGRAARARVVRQLSSGSIGSLMLEYLRAG